MEACKIVIFVNASNDVDVAAPMKHKELCYDILHDAKTVIEATPDNMFLPFVIGPGAKIVISMGMDGVVDVGAPLPNREFSLLLLTLARQVVERFDDAEAPPIRPFAAQLAG